MVRSKEEITGRNWISKAHKGPPRQVWCFGRPRTRPVIYVGIYTHFCRELSVRVTFLHATGIDPYILPTITRCKSAAFDDFGVAGALLAFVVRHLTLSPSMG